MRRLLAVLFCGAVHAWPQASSSLCQLAALSNEERQSVQRGEVVAKILDTSYKKELAVAGVARVRVSRACFLKQFRDIENFKKSPAVRQIGKFSTPINAEDLSRLTLDPQDADALRKCKIGDCAVKVPVAVIQQLARRPSTPPQSFLVQANSVFRDELAAYVRRYLSLGDQELIQYRDKSKPVRLSEQFHSLLDGWKELNSLVPELCAFVTRGPEQPLPFLDEFLYWSKESFGLKPVISVTHATIYQLPDETWIASKQIYASHYFEASLAITLAADDPADPAGRSIYLAYVNRSRIDLLGGALAGLARGMVRGRLQDGMRKNLQQTVTKLESSCLAQTSATCSVDR